jgi:hypothetical protein
MVELFKYHLVDPDEMDRGIALERISEWNKDDHPRIGDYVIMPDGTLERFSHKWNDGMQTSPSGAFYLGSGGYVSFSGGLNPTISYNRLICTPNYEMGMFWIFHHNDYCADNDIGVQTYCRVYRVIK